MENRPANGARFGPEVPIQAVPPRRRWGCFKTVFVAAAVFVAGAGGCSAWALRQHDRDLDREREDLCREANGKSCAETEQQWEKEQRERDLEANCQERHQMSCEDVRDMWERHAEEEGALGPSTEAPAVGEAAAALLDDWARAHGDDATPVGLEVRTRVGFALLDAAEATGAPDPTHPFTGVDHGALLSDPARLEQLRGALRTLDGVAAELGYAPMGRGIEAMIVATAPSRGAVSRAAALTI